MAITLRTVTGSALSHLQVDTNFSSYYYSASQSGSSLVLSTTGSSTIPATSMSINLGLGYLTTATGEYSHAEGAGTRAIDEASHAEGYFTLAFSGGSHAEGYETTASGQASHAEGYRTVSSGAYQHVQGQYNLPSEAQSAFIHGNGTSNTSRSNLIFASGSQVQISGALYISASTSTLAQFVGNQDGYTDFTVRNYSTGISASGDIAVYANDGTVFNNYIDMGINNSGMDSTYSYFGTDFGNAHDAYLYNVGGNLRIGNATSLTPFSQSLFLFSNPTATPNIWITGSQVAIGKSTGPINGTLDVNGNTTVTGSLKVTGSFVPPVISSASRAALVNPATGSVVYQNNSGSGLYVYGGTSWNSVTPAALIKFAHDQTNANTSSIYYFGDNSSIGTLPNSSFNKLQIISQVTGQIVSATVGLTAGTSPTNTAGYSILNIVNVTTGVSSSIYGATGVAYNTDLLANYTLGTPLAITEGNILTVKWETPSSWTNTPTNFVHRISAKVIVTG